MKLGKLAIILVGIASAIHLGAAPGNPVVTVTGGQVQGRILQVGAVFKGIPYAAPPVGDLRWREPAAVIPWAGVRDAGEYCATCAQADSGWNKNSAAIAKEDCLFLNIWTPEWPPKFQLAVMFWIHGGGNAGGSALGAGGIEPPFDGESLSRHDVVVVTINYRLGLFGFMGHPELTAESPNHASGGYGLLDQIAALKWVRDNIRHFGGDPGKVTVFGQSAGAQNTSILITSPLAKGLFRQAILESGSPMISDKRLQTPAQMEQLGVTLAEVLKAPSTGAIKFLRGLPASDILAAAPEFRKRLNGLILDVGMDGYAVPQFSPEVYRSGKEIAVPVIIGSNGRESGGGPRPGGRGDATPPTQEELQAALKRRVESSYARYPDLLERALKAYGFSGAENHVSTYPPYGSVDAQFGTDTSFRCEAIALAGWHSAVAPTWQYEFTGGTASHPPLHSAELCFVFGALADQASDENVRKLSAAMQKYWTNFAKTGDPNNPGLPKWERYDTKTRRYLELSNEGPTPKADLRGEPCRVYVEKLTRDIDARRQP